MIKQILKKFTISMLTTTTLLTNLNIRTEAIYLGSASDPFLIRNMMDFKRTAECMRVNKNWSNGKHFSLQCDITIDLIQSLSQNSNPEYQFKGIFHGNNHTITLPKNASLFGYIGKDSVVENLIIVGNGYFANSNCGTIKNCQLRSEGFSSMVGNNEESGIIQDCKLFGKFSSNAIAGSNSGIITRCLIDAECRWSGIANNNGQKGKISHCRVRGKINSKGNPTSGSCYYAGLVSYNNGIIEKCTVNATFEGGSRNFYLIGANKSNKETLAKHCIVGKDAKGAYEEQMFGYFGDNVEACGYEDWDQIDHCSVK